MLKAKEKKASPIQVNVSDILHSDITHYLILDFIGEGCFGKVAKCVSLSTHNTVAIKLHKDVEDHIFENEVDMLNAVGVLDPDKNNIVRFMDSFSFRGLSCLAFEMLDKSLWQLMEERRREPLSLNEIRHVTQQILVAFDALQSIGIMHTDLKPDNIMLVNHKDQPFKIKLIDFGLALPVSQAKPGITIQARSYRAPEVNLGLPLSEAVDMWGVGCVMAFLYFGTNLFPGTCLLDNMKAICHLVGQPGDDQLCAAKNTWKYFTFQTGLGWRLKTPTEYENITGLKPHISWTSFDMARNLEDAVLGYPVKRGNITYGDMMAFVSLLKCCLHPNAGQRITPREALNHGFVTAVNMVDETGTSDYASVAVQHAAVSSSSIHFPFSILSNPLRLCGSSSYNSEKSSFSVEKIFALSNSLADMLKMASSYEMDSLTDSFGGNSAHPENSSAEFANIGSSNVGDSDTDSYSGESEHRGRSIDQYPIRSSAYDAETESSGDNLEPAMSEDNNNDNKSSLPSYSGEVYVEPGPRRMTLWRRTRKFFGRVRKRVVSILERQSK